MSWLDDAAEADKAGLSYGQYMSIKPKQEQPDPANDPDARFCVMCNCVIPNRDGFRRKTCSEKCRHDWNNHLARKRARIKRGYYNG